MCRSNCKTPLTWILYIHMPVLVLYYYYYHAYLASSHSSPCKMWMSSYVHCQCYVSNDGSILLDCVICVLPNSYMILCPFTIYTHMVLSLFPGVLIFPHALLPGGTISAFPNTSSHYSDCLYNLTNCSETIRE